MNSTLEALVPSKECGTIAFCSMGLRAEYVANHLGVRAQNDVPSAALYAKRDAVRLRRQEPTHLDDRRQEWGSVMLRQ
jgi:hypothetical protein